MSSPPMDWLLQNVRIADNQPLMNFGIRSGHIQFVGENTPRVASQTWDLAGRVILPGLIDLHTHLDKSYTSLENKSGTLLEAIRVWKKIKQTRTMSDIEHTVRKALQLAVVNGVTAMRSHLDMGEACDLDTLAVVQAIQASMRDQIDLELVALGDAAGKPESLLVMKQALERGVDFVGGAPSLTTNPRRAIDATFELAEQLGKPIDLHIDETEDSTMLALEYLAEQTIEHGMQGRVTAGHCCSLAFVEPDIAKRVIDKVAAAEITIVTLPSCNLVLMGRDMHPAPRGTTLVKALLQRGVNVCVASDNVHDPFNPFGCYDLLQIAHLNGHTAHLTGEAELYTNLDMITKHPARAIRQPDYGLAAGNGADFVVLDAKRVLDAVVSPPPRLATFKAGQLIVRTNIERTWSTPENERTTL